MEEKQIQGRNLDKTYNEATNDFPRPYIYRADEIENLILTGRIPGSRRQGRQRLGVMDNLCAWTGRGKIDLMRAMRIAMNGGPLSPKPLEKKESWGQTL